MKAKGIGAALTSEIRYVDAEDLSQLGLASGLKRI